MEVWLSRERESEGTACVVVVSGSRFESFFCLFFFARTAMHVRARTYGHMRAKERPVWLLFLARGLKVFFIFILHVRARTYGHALVF